MLPPPPKIRDNYHTGGYITPCSAFTGRSGTSEATMQILRN